MSAQLEQARAFYQAGQFGKAEAFCRSLLQLEPGHAEAMYLLGLIAAEAGQDKAAMGLIGQAIEGDGQQPDWYRSLASLLERNGHAATALQLLGLGRQQNPQAAGLWLSEADLLARLNRDEDAEAAYRQALARETDSETLHHLSLLLARVGRLDEAGALCAQALALEPHDLSLWLHTGQIAFDIGKRAEALQAWLQALILNPASAAVYRALGSLRESGDGGMLEQALISLDAVPHARLGLHYFLLRQHLGNYETDAALEHGRQALALEPNPLIHEALSDTYRLRGDVGQAIEHLEQAEKLYAATDASAQQLGQLASKQLFLHLMPADFSPEAQARRQADWDERFGHPQTALLPAQRPAADQADKRLRVGYVSADFCQRSPLLMHQMLFAHHDSAQVEMFCYANVPAPDGTTRAMQAQIPGWRDIAVLSDDQAARLIRQDRIDVLVDLNGHSEGNRLGIFARKPAPIQLSGLGFGFPTGVSAFSASITDALLAPAGTEEIYGGRLYRLSHLLHWPGPGIVEPVSPPPHESAGYIAFASGNGLYKLTDEVLSAWARILAACEGSRLLLKSPELTDTGIRQAMLTRLASQGIAAERVEMLGKSSQQEHIAWYSRADIVLDSFPYQGGFSACEPLWMGVPVITRQGGTRAAVSVLGSIGRGEWIASDTDDYVAKAIALAHDPGALRQARESLRAQVESSAIMDGAQLAREVEACYRQLWQEWIQG